MSSESAELERNYGELLNQVSLLTKRSSLRELSGGLTNKNLLVETDSGRYVARISSNSSSLLSINRDSEFNNTKLAAEVGIGAPVFDYLKGKGLLVIGYIDGKTFGPNDVGANLGRIATSLRKLHSAKPFDRDFNMFEIQPNYLKIVQERGFRLPDGYLELQETFSEIERRFAATFDGKVPCNNDLLPANFIDDGKQIWLIDYEYSGNNDACFEIGNIWSEAELPFEALSELVTAYYGGMRADKLARAWLFCQVAKYGWTLWASIQNSVSELDFDFWEWGMLKYDSMREAISSKRFTEMMERL
ncbi:MAG: phosphotransferase [Actinomycetales bacterium]|nr:phosphotransferase [Actinomycetales bacterium]